MKFLIVMLLCASASSVYGQLSMRIRISRILPFSEYYGAKTLEYYLKHGVESWKQLQYRRDAQSKTIAGLERYIIVYGEHPQLDVRPVLYEIIERMVAIHSALPRVTETGRPLLSPGDGMMVRENAPGPSKVSRNPISLAALDNSFVPDEIWDLYTSYGDKIRSKLEKVLQKAPEHALADVHRKEFMRMFDDEFDRSGTREIASVSGGRIDEGGDIYILKKDLPELEPSDWNDEIDTHRFPPKGSFLGIARPDDNVDSMTTLRYALADPRTIEEEKREFFRTLNRLAEEHGLDRRLEVDDTPPRPPRPRGGGEQY